MALFDLLGRAWAMGIIWQLNDGPYTFRRLRSACDDVSPTLLNQRLKELRATGLVDHGRDGYALTPLGNELMTLLDPIGRWSKTWAAEIMAPNDANQETSEGSTNRPPTSNQLREQFG